MRGRRTTSTLRADPNLTPLLDVVLQLITFFMMLVHFGTRIEGTTRAVRLPVLPAALPGAELAIDRLPIAIDTQGRLIVDDGAVGPAESEAWWATQERIRRAALQSLGRAPAPELPTLVLLRADREARLGALRRVLATAQKHGFGRFRLVVDQERQR